MGNGGNPVSFITDPISQIVQGASDALASIDPGPAIGNIGAQIDSSVRNAVPGGWATVGALAATALTAGATSGFLASDVAVDSTVAMEDGSVLTTFSDGTTALTDAQGATTTYTGADGAVLGNANTSTAAYGAADPSVGAQLPAPLSSAVKGAAIGATNSAINGRDPVTGALVGGLTAGVGSEANAIASDLTNSPLASSIAAGAAAGATGSAASGGDPLTGAVTGGLTGGVSNVASGALPNPTDVNPAVTSAALNAAKAALTGGNPVTSALAGAAGSLIGQGVNAVQGALNTPTTVANITQDPNYINAINAGLSPAEATAIAQGASDPTNPAYASTAGVTVSSDPKEIQAYLNSNPVSDATTTNTPLVSSNSNTTGQGQSTANTDSNAIDPALTSIITSLPSTNTNSTGSGSGTSTTATTTAPATNTTSTGTSATTGAGTGVVSTTNTGSGTGTTTGTGTGSGTGTSGASGTGTAAGAIAALTGTTGTTLGSSTMKEAPKGTFSKGTEINLPLASNYAVPVENYAPPTYNPQQLQEIQQAKTGGVIHKAVGGGLSMNPTLMHGRETGHTNLFGSREIPLYNIPHVANGGAQVAMGYQDRTLPEGHNPQFFSEGGLNSIHHRYVTGDGDGTSDSVPAMLANGEFVIPADVVSSIGNGSNDSGAKVLDEFLKVIRAHKQKHDAKHLPPDSKGPLAYLLQAKEKVRA